MAEAGFHFARPEWLWALFGLLPVVAWLIFSVTHPGRGRIHLYAEEHLLPHLTGVRELEVNERWGRFFRWALLWLLAIFAMAGPRWDYTEITAFTPGNNLLILLDISRSMEVNDVQPTRLGRARQEIQDLVLLNRELRIGLIAFATVSHIIAPITEDGQSILGALPALSTNLTTLQGSRLNAALDRAEQILSGQPTDGMQSILLISDGDLDEPNLLSRVEGLAQQGIRLHVLGIGSEDGAAVPSPVRSGELMHAADGKLIISRLNETLLQQLAEAGSGTFQHADYRDQDSRNILRLAATNASNSVTSEDKSHVWNERFYWLLLPLLLILLPAFRQQQVKVERQ